MKKLLMAAVALLFTANIVNAQDDKATTPPPAAPVPVEVSKQAPDQATSNTPPPACDMKNCCIKKGGKMFCVKDGKEIPMDSDMKMKDGSVVSKDGTCMSKDGKKMMMKDGECVDMSGHKCMMAHPADKTKSEPGR